MSLACVQKKTKEEPQDGVKPPSQHYKCSVLVVVLQGPSVVWSCLITAIMPPSVFWVAQLVERQTVIATRLLSEGPWFEPMSRSFCFLVRPDGRSEWFDWDGRLGGGASI